MAQRFLMLTVCRFIETVDDLPSFPGDSRSDEPAIRIASFASHESCFFHSVEETSGIGHSIEKTLAHLVATKSVRLCTSQDSKHVVLCACDSVRLEHLVKGIAKLIRSANHIQLRFLLKRSEWLGLLELVL